MPSDLLPDAVSSTNRFESRSDRTLGAGPAHRGFRLAPTRSQCGAHRGRAASAGPLRQEDLGLSFEKFPLVPDALALDFPDFGLSRARAQRDGALWWHRTPSPFEIRREHQCHNSVVGDPYCLIVNLTNALFG